MPNNDGTSNGLAEVLEANIQLSTGSVPYGKIVSGYVRLKGPLIRATLGKANSESWEFSFTSEEPDNGSGKSDKSDDSMPRFKHRVAASIKWDDLAMQEMMQVARVHLAPLKVFLSGQRLDIGRSTTRARIIETRRIWAARLVCR